MKLIDNWRNAWRLHSVQIFAALCALPDVYNGIAALGWLDQLPTGAMWTLRVLGAIGIVARVVRQGSEGGGDENRA